MSASARTADEKLCQRCGFDFAISWTGHCAHCPRTFNADGYTEARGIVCSSCRRPPERVTKDEPTEICKYCSEKGSNHSDESVATLVDELWRFLGCVCTNQKPSGFNLTKSQWKTKSYYCRNCQQPYSAFLGNTELAGSECPRCHSEHITTDTIENGDCFIECQECKGRVSKRRFDLLSQEASANQRNLGGELGGRNRAADQSMACVHCGCPEVKLAVTQFDENPCVMQLCSRCGSTDFLAGWDRTSDRLGLRDLAAPTANSEPAGFEELTQCCAKASLSSLHPVEDDPDDALLACAHCEHVVSLRTCKDPRIPMTVAALRRAPGVKGLFSSGNMGWPYRTVKVTSLDELKPADQLDFKKALYSHHAIVESPRPDSKELAVIEYTGESNRPTIAACLRALPSKARVQRSLLKFQAAAKVMHRVDYHSLDCFHPKAVLQRAARRIDEQGYNLIASNCEHFSNWAKANMNFSRQVEALREMAKSVLRSAVVKISDYIDDQPQGRGGGGSGSLGAAVTVLQDIRAEMLQVLDSKKGRSTSLRDFWYPIRLVLKWAIRGIPLAVSARLPREAGGKLFWNLDGLLRPVSEAVANAVVPLPLEDGEASENEDDQKKTKRQ